MSWLNDAEVLLPKTETELLEEAKTRKVAELNEAYSNTATPLIKDYPEVEQSTWISQNYEAKSYLAWKSSEEGEAPSTPVLDAILVGRNGEDGGETMEQLCNAVIENADKFTQFQVLTGKRQRLVKQVKLAGSVEEVESIQWENP